MPVVVVAPVTVSASGAEWVSDPDVPVNSTVAVLEGAEDAAARLTGCGVPGTSVNVEGVAVTPGGTPETETWIDPEKPLIAAAETDTICAAPPAVRLMLSRLSESEKSGTMTTVTVSASGAEWVRVPEVPVNSTVAVLEAADAEAERLTCCGVPAISVNADGVAVTPEGNPVTET